MVSSSPSHPAAPSSASAMALRTSGIEFGVERGEVGGQSGRRHRRRQVLGGAQAIIRRRIPGLSVGVGTLRTETLIKRYSANKACGSTTSAVSRTCCSTATALALCVAANVMGWPALQVGRPSPSQAPTPLVCGWSRDDAGESNDAPPHAADDSPDEERGAAADSAEAHRGRHVIEAGGVV